MSLAHPFFIAITTYVIKEERTEDYERLHRERTEKAQELRKKRSSIAAK